MAKNKRLAYATSDSRTGSKIISQHENWLEKKPFLILGGHEFRKNCYLMLELTVEERHSPSMSASHSTHFLELPDRFFTNLEEAISTGYSEMRNECISLQFG